MKSPFAQTFAAIMAAAALFSAVYYFGVARPAKKKAELRQLHELQAHNEALQKWTEGRGPHPGQYR